MKTLKLSQHFTKTMYLLRCSQRTHRWAGPLTPVSAPAQL
jgi:hypothetical protein